MGYLAGPADETRKLAKRANEIYISPNMLAEAVVYELCRSGGLDENIEFVEGRPPASGATRWSRRFASTSRRLSSSFRAAATSCGSLSGDDVDTVELQAAALEEKVAFIAGPDFMLEGGTGSSLRLSFAQRSSGVRSAKGWRGSCAPWSGCARQAPPEPYALAATLGAAPAFGPASMRRRQQTAQNLLPGRYIRSARGT